MLTHGNLGFSVALRKPLLNADQGRLWSRTGTWGRSESERVGEEKCISCFIAASSKPIRSGMQDVCRH